MQKALTQKFIDSTKAAATRQEIGDAITPNLYLLVQPTGSKSWRWRGRHAGIVKRFSLGTYPQFDLQAARIWATELTEQRDSNEGPFAPEAAKPVVEEKEDHRTCDWLFELYMTNEGDAKDSAKEKWRIYNRDIKPIIGSRLVSSITHEDLAKIIRHKHTTAPSASNAIQSLVRRWFRWSVTVGRDISGNTDDPAKDLVKLAPPGKRDRHLSDYEIGLFFEVLAKTDSSFARPLELILYTGVRRMEAFAMRWDEVDFHKKYWIIPPERAKNGEELLLPIAGSTVALLEEQKQRTGNQLLVFPSAAKDDDDEKPMSGFSKAVKAMNDKMEKLAKQDGKMMKKWTIHDLRRTLSSGMNGLLDASEQPLIPPDIVERVINHKIGGVAGIYNRHSYLAEKRKALALWADHLNSIKRLNEKKPTR